MHLSSASYYQINLLPEEAKVFRESLNKMATYLKEEYDEENPMPEAIAGISSSLGPILQLLNNIPQ